MIRDDRRSCRVVGSIAEVRVLREPDVDAVIVRRAWREVLLRSLDRCAQGWIEPVTKVLPPEPALLAAALDALLVNVPSDVRAPVRDESSLALAIVHSLVGAQPLLATIGGVVGDECAKFHQDFVRLRALITFSGPGTEVAPREVIDSRALAHPPLDVVACNEAIVADPTAILRARAGDLVLLKGAAWPACTHGAVHRSPPLGTSGTRRIVLAITAVADERSLAAGTIEGRTGCGQSVLFFPEFFQRS